MSKSKNEIGMDMSDNIVKFRKNGMLCRPIEITYLKVTLSLTKKDILEALLVDNIYINGVFYKVPEYSFIEMLKEFTDKKNMIEMNVSLEKIIK